MTTKPLTPTLNPKITTPYKNGAETMSRNNEIQNANNKKFAGGKRWKTRSKSKSKSKRRHCKRGRTHKRRRTFKGGATAEIIGSRYTSYSGPGQTPKDTQIEIAKNYNQAGANAEYDKYAYVKAPPTKGGSRRRY